LGDILVEAKKTWVDRGVRDSARRRCDKLRRWRAGLWWKERLAREREETTAAAAGRTGQGKKWAHGGARLQSGMVLYPQSFPEPHLYSYKF
jgi:hypothetical protein